MIPPPRRFDLDPAVFRAQAGGPSAPAPGAGAGSSPAPAPTGSTPVPDLSLPAEERAIGGGEPTEITAEAEARPPSRSTITTLLMRACRCATRR